MATPPQHAEHPVSDDPIESITPQLPVVLPVVGGLLIFLLAFIAVYMA